MKKNIYINEDNHHFYGCHPEEDMTQAGVDRLVDFYAENSQVAGIMFCVNVQRALFNSKTWETFYGDYDPKKEKDQTCLKRGHGIKNMWLLNHRGIDYHARWLERCKVHGIEGWLSMRMNDCHGLEEYALGKTSCVDDWPSTFWREHPEFRRAPYRYERSWEGALNYAQKEVQEHHLKLIQELFERYDMYGLELDWMRWGMNFAPGHEQEGLAILNKFMREVRQMADKAEHKAGHPIKIAARIPAEPQSCLALGYDVITWAKEKLIDMITLSSFLGCANFDYPIYIWRTLIGNDVKILGHAEPTAYPFATSGSPLTRCYEFLFASANSALHRGADGIYLFNECYNESDCPELLRQVLTHAGDLKTLKKMVRRHAVTYPQVHAAGESNRTILPIPLLVDKAWENYGRMRENITLRIPTGNVQYNTFACLRLGFSKNTPDLIESDITVRCNGNIINYISPNDSRLKYNDIARELKLKFTDQNSDYPKIVGEILCYQIPDKFLVNDINVIEFIPPQVEGELVWAEILLIPES